jgi:hypothetical protein|tara:strand:+ start:774 stop:941 length:168 start_codon:yes stop_codon:yes gene_type:complete
LHKKSIIGLYISFVNFNIKKEAKVWVTQKNIEEDEKSVLKREEQEKETKESNKLL